MKAQTKQIENEFTPFDLTISIETKHEFDILMAIFSSSKERLFQFVKERYGAKDFNDKEIDAITNMIYRALKFE